MKGNFHSDFISAIHNKRKVMITFSSKEKGFLRRKCAPMDFAIGKREKTGITKYWFWDYEGDKGPHPLGLAGNKINEFVILEESFDPSEFIFWKTRGKSL